MFLAIFAMMRIVGQRESAVPLPDRPARGGAGGTGAAQGLTGEARGVADSLLLVATILAWSVALDAIAYKWPRIAPLIKPRARPLIVDGRIDGRALRREFMQREEVMAELRLHGITDVKEVARAYLESNGMLSVIRTDHRPPDDTRQPTAR